MTARFGFSLQGRGVFADRDAITTLALSAETLGFDSVFVTDRLLIPVRSASRYPYSATGAFPLGPDEPWLEPLTAVTYLATLTARIRIGTSVLVIPYRNPVVTAKALATADYLSGGRLILGAGIGWWREGFEAGDLGEVARRVRADRAPLTGSAAQIAEDLSAYVAAGVEHFVLDFSVPTVPEMLDVLARVAAEVRPRVGG
jgi:alkanesulfonate monooxygenase SsuD/methylene tetrahydromethanopterin reductase-like flavin-dependent oxidoreductase (luciferase family)